MIVPFTKESVQQGLYIFSKAALALLLLVFWYLFFYSLLHRVFYPFELDWIEGEILCHITRLLSGQSIYPPPSVEFIAEMYTPLYYAVCAIPCLIAGTGFPAPRIISLIACFAILFILYRIPVRECTGRAAGLLCSSFFICCYCLHGPWYDVGRVDMLFFMLLVSGCFTIAYYNSRQWAGLCAAALFALACFTKQNGLLFVPFAALYLLIINKKQAILFVCFLFFFLFIGFGLLHVTTDGWATRYTILNLLGYKKNLANAMGNTYLELIQEIQAKLLTEMRYELFYKLPVFLVLLLFFFIYRIISTGLKNLSLWEFTAIPAAAAYFIVRPHIGSEKNDLIYITLWCCILMGVYFPKLAALFAGKTRRSIFTALYLVLALQAWLLLYDPRDIIPDAGSSKRGSAFIAMVRDIRGEVYIPYHAYYAVMAGKNMVFNAGAFWAYQILSPGGYTPTDLLNKISQKHFKAIIVDDKSYYLYLGQRLPFDNLKLLLSSDEPLARVINQNYRYESRLSYATDNEFRNPTAFMTRPEIMLVPRE